jgi:Sulfotransferase family
MTPVTDFAFQPVIIIGAARSGTNMLRDVLTQLQGFDTWPCDEIPFIWRYGNRHHPDDELPPESATQTVRRYIRREFARAARPSTKFLVEKTCANSLRPAYVHTIVPEALFLYIERNGPDAIASAMARWRAPFDPRYSLRKARYVPASDIPHYAGRFLLNRLQTLRTRERRLAFWGPVFKDLKGLPSDTDLVELAARQWKRCRDVSRREFEVIDARKVHSLSYEEFVRNPVQELSAICSFLRFETTERNLVKATSNVRCNSIGKSKTSLSSEQFARLEVILGEHSAIHTND